MRRLLVALLVAAAAPPVPAYHAGDLIVGSTSPEAGALAIQYDFSRRVLVSPSVDVLGTVLHTGTEPGLDALDVPESPLHQLAAGVPVSIELVSIDPAASVQVKAPILSSPGASALIGNMTADGDGLHIHPTWRLSLPAESPVVEQCVSFRLTTTSALYAPSATYTLAVTNAADPPADSSPPACAMATTTTTLPPAPCAGEARGSQAAVRCRYGLLRAAVDALATPTRAARRTAHALFRKTRACGRIIDAAATAPARRAARLHRRALARLAALDGVAQRAAERATLPDADVTAIRALAAALRDEIATTP